MTRREFLRNAMLSIVSIAAGKDFFDLLQQPPSPAQEIGMPHHVFRHQVNSLPPLLVSESRIPNPPDLGTAYTLARLGHRKWQEIFLKNYRGAVISTSTKAYSRSPSENLSIHDFIRTNSKDIRFMLIRDLRSGGYLQIPIKHYDDLKLPNGEQIQGIRLFDHHASGVGLLEEIRLIIPPFSSKSAFDTNAASLVLRQQLKMIYIVIDNNKVFPMSQKNCFQVKTRSMENMKTVYLFYRRYVLTKGSKSILFRPQTQARHYGIE